MARLMRLSEPVQIPELYREIVLDFLRQYVDHEIWRLRNHFGLELDVQDLPANDDDYLRLLIAESCEQIARAAHGDTRGLDQAEVYEHVQGLVEKLFAIPGDAEYEIPRGFWLSDFGNMVQLALVWGMGDELITVSQAVELTGRPHDWFTHAAQRGKITTYPDKTEPNPTKRTRLLKSEVLALSPSKTKKRAAR